MLNGTESDLRVLSSYRLIEDDGPPSRLSNYASQLRSLPQETQKTSLHLAWQIISNFKIATTCLSADQIRPSTYDVRPIDQTHVDAILIDFRANVYGPNRERFRGAVLACSDEFPASPAPFEVFRVDSRHKVEMIDGAHRFEAVKLYADKVGDPAQAFWIVDVYHNAVRGFMPSFINAWIKGFNQIRTIKHCPLFDEVMYMINVGIAAYGGPPDQISSTLQQALQLMSTKNKSDLSLLHDVVAYPTVVQALAESRLMESTVFRTHPEITCEFLKALLSSRNPILASRIIQAAADQIRRIQDITSESFGMAFLKEDNNTIKKAFESANLRSIQRACRYQRHIMHQFPLEAVQRTLGEPKFVDLPPVLISPYSLHGDLKTYVHEVKDVILHLAIIVLGYEPCRFFLSNFSIEVPRSEKYSPVLSLEAFARERCQPMDVVEWRQKLSSMLGSTSIVDLQQSWKEVVTGYITEQGVPSDLALRSRSTSSPLKSRALTSMRIVDLLKTSRSWHSLVLLVGIRPGDFLQLYNHESERYRMPVAPIQRQAPLDSDVEDPQNNVHHPQSSHPPSHLPPRNLTESPGAGVRTPDSAPTGVNSIPVGSVDFPSNAPVHDDDDDWSISSSRAFPRGWSPAMDTFLQGMGFDNHCSLPSTDSLEPDSTPADLENMGCNSRCSFPSTDLLEQDHTTANMGFDSRYSLPSTDLLEQDHTTANMGFDSRYSLPSTDSLEQDYTPADIEDIAAWLNRYCAENMSVQDPLLPSPFINVYFQLTQAERTALDTLSTLNPDWIRVYLSDLGL